MLKNKTIITFGKIDYNENGKETNLITIEIELRVENEKKVFSVCGNIWNGNKSDILCGGQCLDTILEYLPQNKKFKEIYRLWKLYHLNDMNAGTQEQEKAIEEWKNMGNKYEYTKVCEYLKSINLYEIEYNGKPYKYGHSWLYREIPQNDLAKIRNIIRYS